MTTIRSLQTLLALSARMGAAKLQPIPGRPDPMLQRWRALSNHLKPGKSGPIEVDILSRRIWTDNPPGDYARLKIDGELWMTNDCGEYTLNYDAVNQSYGDVLLGGLGIGALPFCIVGKPNVSSVTVIEKSPDVLRVVGSQFSHPKLTIVHDDVTTWTPPAGTKYNTVYFDIWQPLRVRDLPQVAALHQRFAPYLDSSDPEAWLDSWQRDAAHAIVRHYLGTGRVEAPKGWSRTPPALLAMCAEDLQGVAA